MNLYFIMPKQVQVQQSLAWPWQACHMENQEMEWLLR